MNRIFLAFLIVLTTVLIADPVASGRTSSPTVPQWLKAAETQTLDTGFEGARPVRTSYLWYPQKIAVIWQFDHVVVCGLCSAPFNAALPRGRVIRVSFNRQTHGVGGALRFCQTRGLSPLLATCLRR